MSDETRPAEEIRADLAKIKGAPSATLLNEPGASMRLLCDVEPLLRECAELREERDRLRGLLKEADSRWATACELLGDRTQQLADARAQLAEAREENKRHEVFVRAIKDCREDPASAIAQNDIVNGKAIIAAHLAEARAEQAEATIAAVTQLCARWDSERPYLNAEQEPIAAAYVENLSAALAAAGPSAPETPSEEWEQAKTDLERSLDETRAEHERAWAQVPASSDEPARCEHGFSEDHDFGPMHGQHCPGPAASGAPDGGEQVDGIDCWPGFDR